MPHTRPLPDIHVLNDDFDRLAHLIDCLRVPSPGAQLLARELDRATIVGDDDVKAPFVRLGSLVGYEDLDTGLRRDVRILPRQACIEDSTISIFSPTGAALLGLRPGQVFHWKAEDGRIRRLKVLSVLNPSNEA